MSRLRTALGESRDEGQDIAIFAGADIRHRSQTRTQRGIKQLRSFFSPEYLFLTDQWPSTKISLPVVAQSTAIFENFTYVSRRLEVLTEIQQRAKSSI